MQSSRPCDQGRSAGTRKIERPETMIFGVKKIVSYISQFMTLEAGDLISTGTPPGVGLGLKPPTYLRDGDTVELAIAGLGRQQQTCRPA